MSATATRPRPSSSGPPSCSSSRARPRRRGLEIVAISDHFQPWRHHGGHSPAALPWLGAAAQRDRRAPRSGTSVLTPTLRYQPAVIAQAFATLGCLAPGRVFLGVGTGEAMNETPVTGGAFPGRKERRMRMAEAIKLIRALWTRGARRLRGRVLPDASARRSTTAPTSRCRSTSPPPGRSPPSSPAAPGDGFICTSGKDPALYDGAAGERRARAPSRPAATRRASSA